MITTKEGRPIVRRRNVLNHLVHATVRAVESDLIVLEVFAEACLELLTNEGYETDGLSFKCKVKEIMEGME